KNRVPLFKEPLRQLRDIFRMVKQVADLNSAHSDLMLGRLGGSPSAAAVGYMLSSISFSGFGSKKKRASLIKPSVTRKKSNMRTTTSPSRASLKVASHSVAAYSPSMICLFTFAARTGILGNTWVFRNS